jgi:hypothetical protein
MDKEDKKWKRKFIAFLKENGIYEKWIYNMKRQHPASNAAWWNCFADTIYTNRCSEGINHAFYWAYTEDGHYYWLRYEREWKNIIGNGIQELL